MRFYSIEDVQKIAADIEKAVTIPVNIEIGYEHKVYNFSEMKAILENANRIAVQDCGCKTEYNNCDAPRDVCISLDWSADELTEKDFQNSRELNIDEAIEVLKRSHEAGLVHLAYTMKGEDRPSIICSCCPCCCHTLGSLVRNGVHTEILASKYIAEHDRSRCLECGKCAERCAFQARQMREGRLVYEQSKCFGCGLCLSTCPTEAISLALR